MTMKTFIFCDVCNARGVRLRDERRCEERRCEERETELGGRRSTDGRHWIEGSVKDALTAGWTQDARGRHICERCHAFLQMDGRARA